MKIRPTFFHVEDYFLEEPLLGRAPESEFSKILPLGGFGWKKIQIAICIVQNETPYGQQSQKWSEPIHFLSGLRLGQNASIYYSSSKPFKNWDLYVEYKKT